MRTLCTSDPSTGIWASPQISTENTYRHGRPPFPLPPMIIGAHECAHLECVWDLIGTGVRLFGEPTFLHIYGTSITSRSPGSLVQARSSVGRRCKEIAPGNGIVRTVALEPACAKCSWFPSLARGAQHLSGSGRMKHDGGTQLTPQLADICPVKP